MKHFYVLFMQSVSPFAALQIEFALVNCCKGKKEKKESKAKPSIFKKRNNNQEYRGPFFQRMKTAMGRNWNFPWQTYFLFTASKSSPAQRLPTSAGASEVLKANVEPSVYF